MKRVAESRSAVRPDGFAIYNVKGRYLLVQDMGELYEICQAVADFIDDRNKR